MKKYSVLPFGAWLLFFAFAFALPASAQEDKNYFTVVLLPDTQFYAEKYHDIFPAQTTWIRDNVEEENIKMVIHLGDIVQNRNESENEWQVARDAFKIIDGVVPYTVAPGNHDQDYNKRDSTLYNKYFPASDYKGLEWYGGNYGDDNDNNYTYFEGKGRKFMVLNLEYLPDDEMLAWADGVVQRHPRHRVIFATHHYLNHNGRVENADTVWSRVIRKNANIFMAVCGHITGLVAMTDLNDDRDMVYQIMSDYQGMSGGKGWMLLMKFVPEEDKIIIREFSPVSTNKEDRGIPTTLMLHYDM